MHARDAKFAVPPRPKELEEFPLEFTLDCAVAAPGVPKDPLDDRVVAPGPLCFAEKSPSGQDGPEFGD